MKLKHNLYRQIITIVLIMFAIIYVSVAIILPKVLAPIYEKNIYLNLKTPLNVIQHNLSDNEIDDDIAYIYIKNGTLEKSNNLESIIDLKAEQILEKIKDNYGKFTYHGKTYYYNTKTDTYSYKVAITNDNYVKEMKSDIWKSLFPILIITLLFMLIVVAIWSQVLAEKIKILKDKVDNLDNENYSPKTPFNPFRAEDELKVLSEAIDKMKMTLKTQDEYKNQMYQNISHDFKTPLTVIKSYIEAIEDGVENEKDGLKVIKQEIKKLEIKVHSLLYLNKLTYIKDMDAYKNETINIVDILPPAVQKFKLTRPDVKWELNIADKKTIFKGTEDMWEAIIDNILSNFIRYAKENVKITVRGHKITLFNDGEAIDEAIFNDIFTPYKKGIKGEFGLGLSIVKKTLSLLGYEISVKNEKNGISFIIK